MEEKGAEHAKSLLRLRPDTSIRATPNPILFSFFSHSRTCLCFGAAQYAFREGPFCSCLFERLFFPFSRLVMPAKRKPVHAG